MCSLQSIYNIAKMWKQPKMSISRWMGKKEVVCLYNGILLSHKKRMNSCHLQQHGWAQGHYAEWTKSDKYRMISLLCGIYQTRWTDLAGVAQRAECRPAKVAGLVLRQGTGLGCGPRPQLEACERQPMDVSVTHRCFSSSLPPSLPLSKNK